MESTQREQKITACNAIYNEGKNLRRLLDRHKNIIDEWIFVHDGPCTDDSIKILEEYKQKGFDIKYVIGPKIGEPEPHRITAYKMASHEWIFINDPDQYLNDALLTDVRKLVAQKDVDEYDALRTYYDGKEHHITDDSIVLLYRKSNMWATAMPHSRPVTTGKRVLLKEPYLIYHEHIKQGTPTLRGQFQEKYRRWARVHAEYYLKEFDESLVFQAEPDVWYTKKRQRIIQRPRLMALFYFVYNVLKGFFIQQLFRQGWDGVKSIFGYGYYTFLTCWYVSIIKKNEEANV